MNSTVPEEILEALRALQKGGYQYVLMVNSLEDDSGACYTNVEPTHVRHVLTVILKTLDEAIDPTEDGHGLS